MKLRSILTVATLLAASGAALADAPRIYLQMQSHGVQKWTWLASNPQVCGAHIVFPWSPIDNGSGVYDWSSVEAGIKPWAAAGKKVGLTFAGVDETLDAEGSGNTTVLATPEYVMKKVDVVTCAPTMVNGSMKAVPPTPVYWEPGYHKNWEKFIQAAITKYQSDRRIAYMRFGTGAGGESGPMVGVASDPACTAKWNAVGMSYSMWLNNALSIVDFVGSLHPQVPITFGVNKLEVWDLGNLSFAYSLSAEAARFGFVVGNAGFNGLNAEWNALYQMHSPATYMQMANPHISDDLFPTYLQNAKPLGIQMYELYPDDYQIAYNPPAGANSNVITTFRTVLKAVGTPLSCGVNPLWSGY